MSSSTSENWLLFSLRLIIVDNLITVVLWCILIRILDAVFKCLGLIKKMGDLKMGNKEFL